MYIFTDVTCFPMGDRVNLALGPFYILVSGGPIKPFSIIINCFQSELSNVVKGIFQGHARNIFDLLWL